MEVSRALLVNFVNFQKTKISKKKFSVLALEPKNFWNGYLRTYYICEEHLQDHEEESRSRLQTFGEIDVYQ